MVERDIFDNVTLETAGTEENGRGIIVVPATTNLRAIAWSHRWIISVYIVLKRAAELPLVISVLKLHAKKKQHAELMEWKAKGFGTIPHDETFECRECGQIFWFTIEEQIFFRSKGFRRPGTCKICRKN